MLQTALVLHLGFIWIFWFGLQEGKIAVVVGTVTDDIRVYEVPTVKVIALRFTETARAACSSFMWQSLQRLEQRFTVATLPKNPQLSTQSIGFDGQQLVPSFCSELIFPFLSRISDGWQLDITGLFLFLFFINLWICVLRSGFVFLFKTHLDLNSYDFQFLILFLIFLFS